MCGLSEPWAQLVSTTENESDPVHIGKNKFIIGRSKNADLCLISNKLVSGTHCFIERDSKDKVWLQDTSTNGTLLNLTNKLVGIKTQLQHGDEIYVVYRKNEPSLNVAYLFQDLAELKKEEEESSEATQEYGSATLDITEETSQTSDASSDPIKESDDSIKDDAKRKIAEVEDADPINTPAEKKQKCEPDLKESKPSEATKTSECPVPDDFEESLICIICQDIMHQCVSCQPCMHSFCGGCYSDWMDRSSECPSCRARVERVNKNFVINNLIDAYLKNHPKKKRCPEELKALEGRNKIGNDSIKPPAPARTISELIDDEEEEEEEEEDAEPELSVSEEEDADPNDDGGVAPSPFTTTTPTQGFGTTATTGGGLFGPTTGTWFGGLPRYIPPKTICRQCPEYRGPGSVFGTAAAALTSGLSQVINMVAGGGDAATSTGASGTGATPDYPKYNCVTGQVHVLCQCCLKPMPDRRTASYTDKTIPSQQCTMCYRIYCHAYWGCHHDGCSGCLGKFKDLNFGPTQFNGLIMENAYESDIFKNYITSKAKTMQDVVQTCLKKLDSGDYTCVDQARGANSNSVLCFSCGCRNLRDLTYQYRKDIPNEDLPAAVTNRANCYYGKNCRTQRGNVRHAANFNHICEQTKH